MMTMTLTLAMALSLTHLDVKEENKANEVDSGLNLQSPPPRALLNMLSFFW